MIIGAAAVTMEPELRAFDKGLLFVKDTDILLSGDKWTIAVNIALNDSATLVDEMRQIWEQMRQKIQVQKSPRPLFDMYWGEIGRLEMMIQEFDSDLRGFRSLLLEEAPARNFVTGSARPKRGLIYWGTA